MPLQSQLFLDSSWGHVCATPVEVLLRVFPVPFSFFPISFAFLPAANLRRFPVIGSKSILASTGTQQIFIGFQWYAANLYRLPVVRSKFVQGSSGTQQIHLSFHWYGANLYIIPMVRSNFTLSRLLARRSDTTRPPDEAAG